MSPLDAALALAARNIPVFPCLENKAPACRGGFKDATVDPATIRQMFATPEAKLVGVPTGESSGLDVLDLDPRHGSDGWFREHGGGIPGTLTHRTRNGGLHIVFRHKPGLRCSAGGRGSGHRPGVDIKADGGYIIHWPSAGVTPLHEDTPAEWPEQLFAAIVRRPTTTPGAAPPEHSASAPPSASDVTDLLAQLPNPLSADRDTYTRVMLAAVGCVRALGGDPDGAIEDAAVSWAERWEGGPSTDERQKWHDDWSRRGAVTAGWSTLLGVASQLMPGFIARSAGSEFDPLPPLPEPSPRALFPEPFRLPVAASIRPREWIYGRHYIRKFISATVAPGGVGKSSNAIVEALDMVTGRGLLSGKPAAKRFRVVYFNGEDPLEETERRVVDCGRSRRPAHDCFRQRYFDLHGDD